MSGGFMPVSPSDMSYGERLASLGCDGILLGLFTAPIGAILAIVTSVGIRIGFVPHPSLWSLLGYGLSLLLLAPIGVFSAIMLIAQIGSSEERILFP